MCLKVNFTQKTTTSVLNPFFFNNPAEGIYLVVLYFSLGDEKSFRVFDGMGVILYPFSANA
jgi:hypothetical protein